MITVPTTMADCVEVDADGWIELRGDLTSPLSQREAAELAYELLDAIRLSQDRNQIGTKTYNDSVNIIRRQASPVGKATAAVRRVF